MDSGKSVWGRVRSAVLTTDYMVQASTSTLSVRQASWAELQRSGMMVDHTFRTMDVFFQKANK